MPSPTGTQYPGGLDTGTSIGTAVATGNTVAHAYADIQSSALLAMETALGVQSGALVWKFPVRLASAAALPANTYNGSAQTLTATTNAALSVDSVTVAANDRILIKNEATQSHNGIYVVTATGGVSAAYVLTRATDGAASTAFPPGAAVGVSVGTLNAATAWSLTTQAPIVLDTSALDFEPLVGAAAGAGPAYGTGGGSANAYTLTLAAAPSGYAEGQAYLFVASFANTGAATLNVNGLGAQALTKFDGTALVSGDIASGQAVWAVYDGTQFQVVSTGPILTPAAGGTGNATYSKGDLLVASSATSLVRETVGSNGQVLTAASAQTAGVQWATSTIGVEQGGTLNSTEPNVNFIAGNGMYLTVADNPGSSRADVTLTNIGSGNTGGRYAFLDGSDGNVTFDGTSMVLGMSPSGSAYTLNRTIMPANMTVNTGVTIKAASYLIFVQQTLTNNGTISNNGSNATGSGGGNPAPTNFLYGSNYGGNGLQASGQAGSDSSGRFGAAGGAGGAGTGAHTGGAGGTMTTATAAQGGLSLPRMWGWWWAGTSLDHVSSHQAAAGGGGGGGDNPVNNYGGGGGGGGGWLVLCARTITGTGTIEANGGNGYTPTLGNCGGGGGGGGGMVCLWYESLGGGQTVQANGGTHGNGIGTGSAGSDGSAGLVYSISCA